MQILHKYNRKILFESDKVGNIEDLVLLAIRKEADLHGANLQGAYLHGADLQGAYLHGADLREADLQEANLRGADLQEANLREAYLQGAYLQGAYLQGADLQGAYLRGADLRGADLRGAYLQGAYLRGADLREADLRGADLRGADLRGADLREADLQEAKTKFGVLTKTPIQLLGLIHDIFITEYCLQIGCEHHKTEEWDMFDDKDIERMGGVKAVEEWNKHKDGILSLTEHLRGKE